MLDHHYFFPEALSDDYLPSRSCLRAGAREGFVLIKKSTSGELQGAQACVQAPWPGRGLKGEGSLGSQHIGHQKAGEGHEAGSSANQPASITFYLHTRTQWSGQRAQTLLWQLPLLKKKGEEEQPCSHYNEFYF